MKTIIIFWTVMGLLMFQCVGQMFSTSCKVENKTFYIEKGTVGTYFLLKSTNYFTNNDDDGVRPSKIKYSLNLPGLNCSYERQDSIYLSRGETEQLIAEYSCVTILPITVPLNFTVFGQTNIDNYYRGICKGYINFSTEMPQPQPDTKYGTIFVIVIINSVLIFIAIVAVIVFVISKKIKNKNSAQRTLPTNDIYIKHVQQN